MRMVLLGPPGSGKGTLAGKISENLGIVHISTGDIFRKNIRENTELGREAKSYMDRGDLVPDELTIRMLADRLANEDAQNGFLLDGFPRTIEQADALTELLAKEDKKVDIALNVYVPDKLILERLSGRRVCPQCGATYNIYSQPSKVEGTCDNCRTGLIQRDDDKEETIRRRLDTYELKTAPLIDYYDKKGVLKTVDNTGSIEETWSKLKEVLPS